MNAKDTAQIVQSAGVTLGVLIGGGWAWYRYLIQRASETSLAMEMRIDAAPPRQGESRSVVFVDTSIQNTGNRRLRTTRRRPALRLGSEAVDGPLTLQVRRLRASLDEIPANEDPFEVVPGLESLDLMEVFHRSHEQLWFEPGEKMHYGRAVVLADGEYLAHVTFVGKRAGELWRHSARFSVPARQSRADDRVTPTS